MQNQLLTTPRPPDLHLSRLRNDCGFEISRLPNGAIFALEHVAGSRRVMINRCFGSPIAGSMGRLYLRVGGAAPMILAAAGAQGGGTLGTAPSCFVWQEERGGIAHRVTLALRRDRNLWWWIVQVRNQRAQPLPCDALLVQDLGVGEPGFLMNNEAYASQYLDHYIARHPRMGPVLMARQNLAQSGRHPWVAHGCVEAASGFATDFAQLGGPGWRDADDFDIPFGAHLASVRLQHETACAALQSPPATLAPGGSASWTFFGGYLEDHPHASAQADLAWVDEALAGEPGATPGAPLVAARSAGLLVGARCVLADDPSEDSLQQRYPDMAHCERRDGQLLSFFTGAASRSRHIVLRAKELRVLRRHGALLVGGARMLPDRGSVCVTCWMHGVFGAQLALGNTSFHRLWSVSRDPYNITRGSGLRLLIDAGDGWQLLTVPSIFEMGLADCAWIYQLGNRTITVSAAVAGDDAVVQWRACVQGPPCRFTVVGQLVIGEHELAHASQLEVDLTDKRFTFRPEPGGLWSQQYPSAVYHLVTSTPACIEAMGSDELLYADGSLRTGGYAVLRTATTNELVFAVVGSLTEPVEAEALAARYSSPVGDAALQASALAHWDGVMRGIRVASAVPDPEVSALDSSFPWLVHDAMVHLTVPHGLEQYTGGAWGTRDVCQGPLELLLALEHDDPAKSILRIIFAQQYVQRGDWPQWFMLEPYSAIQDREAHGDVIVWPLKALCDYVEATGDFAILEEPVPWRREDTLERTEAADPIAVHLDKLIATVQERFVPGTRLLRYGNGDWNDSLQPVDPAKRDWMVSSWTVALLYQQLCRYAEISRRSGRSDGARERSLASAIREDFNRFLIREGTVAGYGEFTPAGGLPELLLHPQDRRTGLRYSLLPMLQGILGALFTPEQVRHHLALIRDHLSFPDGVRLTDRPLPYHGGTQLLFQRAESAAFFGREIGLMYTHAHLRYAQMLALLGEAQPLWDALAIVSPLAVTERLPQAGLRQRNAYFSSSDAAFADRYQASAEWDRVRSGEIPVEGGWRIYSSGPGLYVNLVVGQALGMRRQFGARIFSPCLPIQGVTLRWHGKPVSAAPPP
jgi:1,2-beta-oligoglucan phosphorylase